MDATMDAEAAGRVTSQQDRTVSDQEDRHQILQNLMNPIDISLFEQYLSEQSPTSISKTRQADNAKNSIFFRLPLEIRREIYRLCVPTGFVFDVRERTPFRGEYIFSVTPEALTNRGTWDFDGPSPHYPAIDGIEHARSLEEEDDDFNPGYNDYPDEYDEYNELKDSFGEETDRWINAVFPWPGFLPTIQALLTTSHQVRAEVLDVLYGENVFRVILGQKSSTPDLDRWSWLYQRRIRHLMLVYKQFGTFADYRPECFMSTRIYREIIPRLTTLHLVLGQPTGDKINHAWPCRSNVANQMKLWQAELPPFLQELDKWLPEHATVLVDCNEKKVTTEILRKHMRRQCTKVRTMSGDVLFSKPTINGRPATRYDGLEWMDDTMDDMFGSLSPTAHCNCVPWPERRHHSDDESTEGEYSDSEEELSD